MRELEEKKVKRSLRACTESTFCHDVKVKGKERECCKDWVGLRAIRHWTGPRDTMSVESCSSSMAGDMEEVCSESSRKMKDVEETTSGASWTTVTGGKETVVWRLEPEGEVEKPAADLRSIDGAWRQEHVQEPTESHRKSRRRSSKRFRRRTPRSTDNMFKVITYTRNKSHNAEFDGAGYQEVGLG